MNSLLKKGFILLTFLNLFAACVNNEGVDTSKVETSDENGPQDGSFAGCQTFSAFSTSQISGSFDFPAKASAVRIYRDGILAYQSFSPANTAFVDTGLNEGQTYTYTCEANIKGKSLLGTNRPQVTTLSVNAPTFTGIYSATITGSSTAQIKWPPVSSSGVAAATFQIFATPGSTINWAGTPIATISATSASISGGYYVYDATGLGDDMPYTFGVRACSAASNCSNGTNSPNYISGTTSDGGAPATSGISVVTTQDGKLKITAPFVHTNGGIDKRRLYLSTDGVNFNLEATNVVADRANPDTTLWISNILENTLYYIRLTDQDPGGMTTVHPTVTFTTGDLTPPTFTGIATLVRNATNPDTEMDITFSAIARQGTGDAGASDGATYYDIYKHEVAYATYAGDNTTLKDSCGADGSVHVTLNASGYAPGVRSYTITGLSERMMYSFCMKARDAANNSSTNNTDNELNTTDKTAPTFDGIQTLAYNGLSTTIDTTWNASSSSDISHYVIYIGTGGSYTQLANKTHGSYPTGYNITQVDYAFTDSVTYDVYVEACDTAASLPGGSINCTALGTASKKTITMPDTTPPTWNLGFEAVGNQITTTSGVITLDWQPPSPWTADFAGFKVYTESGGALTQIWDCPCAIPGSCVNSDSQCTITGLGPNVTYNFHVRPYDAYGNIYAVTPFTPPKIVTKTIADDVAPTFASSLNVGGSPTYALSWAAASDDQQAGVISYDVYRKAATNFSDNSQATILAEGTLMGTTTSLSYSGDSFTEGQTYYYTVCAKDAQSNKKCDGTIVNFTVADITPPTIAAFTTNRAINDYRSKKWNLSFTVTDNFDAAANITINLYESYTTSAPATATTSDNFVTTTTAAAGSITNIEGPANLDRYVNYLLVATDQAGNQASSTLSLYSKNAMSVISIGRAQGLTAGGDLVVVYGRGFYNDSLVAAAHQYSTNSTITIGGSACTSPTIYSMGVITCTAPSGSLGAQDVVVTNPDGSSATLSGGYTYLASSSHICDNPGSWGNEVASGAGTSGDPFIICSPDHLQRLADDAGQDIASTGTNASSNYKTGGFYFKLGKNIDMTAYSWSPIADLTTRWAGNLDGDGHAVLNLTSSGSDNIGLFGGIQASTISNLGIINPNLTASVGRLGGISGYVNNTFGSTTIDHSYVVGGSVTGVDYFGGFIGQVQSGGANQLTISNSHSATTLNLSGGTTSDQGVGGFIGNFTCASATVSNGWNETTFTGGTKIYTGGFFGEVNNAISCSPYTATITNSFNMSNISSGNFTGGLVGIGSKTGLVVTNSYNLGDITATQYAGGLVGGINVDNTGATHNVSNAYNLGDVASTGTGSGGLFGNIGGNSASISFPISNVYNKGAVSGLDYTGGLFGSIAGSNITLTISDCYNTGSVSWSGSNTGIGGIAGQSYITGTGLTHVTIQRCYNTGSVSGTAGNTIGGFLGLTRGVVLVQESYSSGNVSAGSASRVGGFIGDSLSTNTGPGYAHIINNWSTGTVTGGTQVGGFVGRALNDYTHLENNYATGAVSGSSSTGGFLGAIAADTPIFSNNFWNTTTTGQATSAGSGAGSIEGKTTSEMQDQATPTTDGVYGNAGWDFASIWEWSTGSGVYPRLQNNN